MTPSLLERPGHGGKLRQPAAADLIQDLNLACVFKAMAHDDDYLYKVSSEVMLCSVTDLDTITYRQEILRDCLNNASEAQRLYQAATKAVFATAKLKESTRPNYTRVVSATTRVASSAKLLDLLLYHLGELRQLVRGTQHSFRSSGMTELLQMVNTRVTDDFLDKAKRLAKELQFLGNYKLVLGAKLGGGLKGDNYVLRSLAPKDSEILNFLKKPFISKSVMIPLENINFSQSAKDFQEAAMIQVLKSVNHFSENIVRFFEELRYQIGFYHGCVNLRDALAGMGAAFSFPTPLTASERSMVFEGLYDISLALQDRQLPIANDVAARDKWLFIVTGANQGGKSTYLRSVGLAHLMMQCGMFVAARSFEANVCDAIYTHFTRGEDTTMNSGKLDKELSRMNDIMNRITKDSLILMNESFATTTEREGAKIATDIILALFEAKIKTIYVTHLYDFASGFYGREDKDVLFLRAERQEGGLRTFRIVPGKPLHTSYGEDLYNSIIEPLEKERTAI